MSGLAVREPQGGAHVVALRVEAAPELALARTDRAGRQSLHQLREPVEVGRSHGVLDTPLPESPRAVLRHGFDHAVARPAVGVVDQHERRVGEA